MNGGRRGTREESTDEWDFVGGEEWCNPKKNGKVGLWHF